MQDENPGTWVWIWGRNPETDKCMIWGTFRRYFCLAWILGAK